jgi:hypothetical protein
MVVMHLGYTYGCDALVVFLNYDALVLGMDSGDTSELICDICDACDIYLLFVWLECNKQLKWLFLVILLCAALDKEGICRVLCQKHSAK